MAHLDRNAVQAILRGDPEAMARYASHLDQTCEVCEALLLEDDVAPELDGEVDRALLGAATTPEEAPLDELGFRRVQKALAGERRSALWPKLSALAAVLVVGAFGVSSLRDGGSGPTGELGIKGTRRIAVELQVAVRAADGALRRVEPATPLTAGEGVLLLRYHATEKGSAALVRKLEGGAPEVLGNFELEPGTHDLSSSEGLAGVPVPDARGSLTLWLVFSPSPEPPLDHEALAAIREGGASSFAVVEVGLELR